MYLAKPICNYSTILPDTNQFEKKSEVFQHLGGGEVGDGVAPVGGELRHGEEEEVAVGQVRVGNLQGGGVDDEVVDGDDVDIHQAVDVTALLVAVRGAAQAALDVVDAVEHLVRVDVADQADAQVHKAVLALKSPRLALDDARDGTAARASR